MLHEVFPQTAVRELFEETGKIVFARQYLARIHGPKSELFLFRDDFDPICEIDEDEIDQYKWIHLGFLHTVPISTFTKAYLRKLSEYMRFPTAAPMEITTSSISETPITAFVGSQIPIAEVSKSKTPIVELSESQIHITTSAISELSPVLLAPPRFHNYEIPRVYVFVVEGSNANILERNRAIARAIKQNKIIILGGNSSSHSSDFRSTSSGLRPNLRSETRITSPISSAGSISSQWSTIHRRGKNIEDCAAAVLLDPAEDVAALPESSQMNRTSHDHRLYHANPEGNIYRLWDTGGMPIEIVTVEKNKMERFKFTFSKNIIHLRNQLKGSNAGRCGSFRTTALDRSQIPNFDPRSHAEYRFAIPIVESQIPIAEVSESRTPNQDPNQDLTLVITPDDNPEDGWQTQTSRRNPSKSTANNRNSSRPAVENNRSWHDSQSSRNARSDSGLVHLAVSHCDILVFVPMFKADIPAPLLFTIAHLASYNHPN